MMDLSLSESEEMLRGSARALFEKSVDVTLLSELEASEDGHSARLWETFVELGWTALGDLGNERGNLIALGVLVAEFGRAGYPSPFLATMAASVVASGLGDGERAAALVGEINAGRPAALVVPADLESAAVLRPGKSKTLVGGPFTVEWAGTAECLVCLAREGDGCWGVYAVDPTCRGVEVEAVTGLDNERIARVRFDRVPVGADARLNSAGVAETAVRESLAVVRLLRAAMLVGGAERMLELTVHHVTNRQQFGRPIGTFQAVQAKCADMAMYLDGAWLATYEGLWRASEGRPCRAEAAVAGYMAGGAAELAAVESAQLHGGVGFMKEFVLQYFFRRAKAAQLRLGSEAQQLEEIARCLVDNPVPGWAKAG